MKNKIILLDNGILTIDGIRHQSAVIISPIGELTISITNLESGLQTSHVMLDAVAAVALNDAQNAFYRGEYEEEMSETP